MKKYIFSFVAMAAAVMGCNKAEIDEPQTDAASGGETYTIEATISSTKTTYAPPYTVTWDDDDALSVIASLDGAYTGHRFNKGEGNIFIARHKKIYERFRKDKAGEKKNRRKDG